MVVSQQNEDITKKIAICDAIKKSAQNTFVIDQQKLKEFQLK